MSAAPKGKLPVGGVARDVFRVYRRHWWLLVSAAIVILLPQALVDEVRATVEELTHRRVRRFVPAYHVGPDLELELFFLES